MRLGVYFDGFASVPDLLTAARAAEDAGAGSLWFAQHMGHREAFICAAAAAGVTWDLIHSGTRAGWRKAIACFADVEAVAGEGVTNRQGAGPPHPDRASAIRPLPCGAPAGRVAASCKTA
jgi:hypothetical protein